MKTILRYISVYLLRSRIKELYIVNHLYNTNEDENHKKNDNLCPQCKNDDEYINEKIDLFTL